MKTTLDLPDQLMEEAMQLTDIKTKIEVIIVARQELIAELRAYKGKINLDMDMDLLRNRNAHSG
ncbi:MAG: type II toxin-antitoxin system VapB family antitoxin [Methylococcaceae bacterium]